MTLPTTLARGVLVLTAALTAAACGSGGESCFPTTVCKEVDLLAACGTPKTCAQTGMLKLSATDPPQAATTVQLPSLDSAGDSSVLMQPGSTLLLPVLADAATRAELPILAVGVFDGDPRHVALVFDGAPAACPLSTDGSTLRCSLPPGVKSIQVKAGVSAVVTMALTELTCTGQTQTCLL